MAYLMESVVGEIPKVGHGFGAPETVGGTPLHSVSKLGDFKTVMCLLQEKYNPLAEDETGAIPLHYACTDDKNLEVVKLLLNSEKASINHKTSLGFTPLHIASYSGSMAIVELLTSYENCDANSQSSDLNTPLHLACIHGHVNIANHLIERHADVNLKNRWGNIPLHCACYGGFLWLVKHLIAESDINSQNQNHNTPLHFASQQSHIEIITCLIEKECDINLTNKMGYTPLHSACSAGHVDAVKLLTSHKECNLNCQGKNKNTPLHIACQKNHANVAKHLIQEGCHIHIANKWGNTPLHIASGKGNFEIVNALLTHECCNPNDQNKDKNTSLHLACWKGHANIAERLINAGCDLGLVNNWGDTPLHIACEGGDLNIVKLLATPEHLNIPNTNLNTPLHLACWREHLEIVRFLVENYSQINSKNKWGNTPLHISCERGNLNIVAFIISQDHCDINNQNENKNTSLHIACQKGCLEIVSCLIEKGCGLNLRNNSGNTPLHLASEKGHINIVKLLTEQQDCLPISYNENKNTSLHLACQSGHLDIVKYLATKYQHPDIKDICGNSPLHMACDSGHLDVVKFLVEELQLLCDVNHQNSDLETPLHIACKGSHVETAHYLIKKGSIVHLCNKRGDSPLHTACRSNCLAIILFLACQQSCDLNGQNKNLNTPLHISCKGGNLEIVRCLVQKSCDINCINKWGCTPLHQACSSGYFSIFKLLTDQKECQLDCQNDCKNTPLHLACFSGHSEIVAYLVDKISDPNISNRWGNTPLHVACGAGHLDVVKILLSHKKCNVNCRNENGNTPIHLASQKCHVEIAECLLENSNCDINAANKCGDTPLHIACVIGQLRMIKLFTSQRLCQLSIQNIHKNTPLHLASQKGHLQVIRHLIESHFHGNLQNESHCCQIHKKVRDTIRVINKPGVDVKLCHLVNAQNVHGNTPLHIACQNGHFEVAKCLIENYCNSNLQNKLGNSPIHTAYDYGHTRMVRLLISDLDSKDEDENTLLHIACWKGNLEFASFLIEKISDVNVKNKQGNTALHIACENCHLDVVKLLSSKPECDLNCQSIDQKTPLHFACLKGNIEIASCLIQKGCKLNIQNYNGNTPLHIACENCDLNIIKLLCSQSKCDLNCQNEDKNTPLHFVCLKGNTEVARYLIEKGCNINIQNGDGNTPLHTACDNGHLNLVKLFIRQKECNLNCQNKNNNTPLHLACLWGDSKIAKCLIQKECDINSCNKEGNTPLHIACQGEHPNIVSLLCNHEQCDLNSQNESNVTPLHCACSANNLEVVKLLLATGKIDPRNKNILGKTAVESAHKYSIIKEISRYSKTKLKYSLESLIQIFVLGNASAGKSTLIEVLCREAIRMMKYAPRLVKMVSNVEQYTAGVIPYVLHSKKIGSVIFYDFAGQQQYYTSHSTVIETSVLSSPPLFIVVVNLERGNNEIKQQVEYWLNFIENNCTRSVSEPHLVVVGSHADKVKPDYNEKACIVSTAVHSLHNIRLHFVDFVGLDCRMLASSGLHKLRSIMTESCSVLREGQNIYFGCHALYAFLLEKFREKAVCTISDIASCIQQSDVLLPQTVAGLLELLKPIGDKGLLLLLKNTTTPANSWVILQKSILISKIYGTVFAPVYFKQHELDFATRTGVVPFTRIRDIFSPYDPNMITSFMIHLEFCQEISDKATLDSIENGGKTNLPRSELMKESNGTSAEDRVSALNPHISEEECLIENGAAGIKYSSPQGNVYSPDSEKYFLFPALVKVERPTAGVWEIINPPGEYCCGWYLYCTKPWQFLTTRFLHVLLLRVAFSPGFELIQDTCRNQESVVLTRRCSIWKNGIRWQSKAGVETIIEVPEQNRSVIVMMHCPREKVISCAKLRSAVIQKVLAVKSEFCPRVTMNESFIHPSNLQLPLGEIEKFYQFSLHDIAEAVLSDKPDETYLCSSTGIKSITAEELLGFEPYLGLGHKVVHRLLSERSALSCVSDVSLLERAKLISTTTGVSLCKEITYMTLSKDIFDKFSIFCGRNPKELTSNIVSASQPTTDYSSMHPTTLLQEVDDSILDIKSLLEFRTELKNAVPEWSNLGLALGLFQPTLESIRSENSDDTGQCLTEVLAAWFHGKDNTTSPSWRTLTETLLNPVIQNHSLCQRIADSHGESSSTLQRVTYTDLLQETNVDDSEFDDGSLHGVIAALLSGGSHFSWFDLGLALGLYYGTLKDIQARTCNDHFQDYLRDTIAAWLRQKDRVPQHSLPSWRSLAGALVHPLVNQRALAEKIVEHHSIA